MPKELVSINMSLKPRASRLKAASLFSSAGIGELGIEAAGLDIVLQLDLEQPREMF